MQAMAKHHERKIKDMLGEANTPKSTYVFRDKSQLIFMLSSEPNMTPVGPKGCQAADFVRDVQSFRTFHAGYEFTFKDGSLITINLRDVSVT